MNAIVAVIAGITAIAMEIVVPIMLFVEGATGWALAWFFIVGPVVTGVVGMIVAGITAGVATALGKEV
jgi:hypothetical protein